VILSGEERATLDHSRVFNDFRANLPEKSNIFTWYNTRNAIPELQRTLSASLSEQLYPVMDSIRNVESVAFQYSNSDGRFYSNIFLRYNPAREGEGPLQWQLALDTALAGRPVIFPVNRSGDHAVAVADLANNLYIVSSQGHIVRKLPIMGNLLGTFHSLKIAGEDTLCLVFNTDTHLYLLKADGTFADKYPMRFPLHATSGITLIPGEEPGSHRIMVAFQDNRVYCFTLDGISCQAWNRPGPGEEIADPVVISSDAGGETASIGISGISGNTVITNGDGIPTITPGRKIVHSPASAIYLNRTNRRGIFLSSSTDGKVIFINRDGKTSETTLNFFSREHRFFYADITGSDQPDYIFSDKNVLYYYTGNNKLTYSYAFRREINTPPFLLRGFDGKAMLGYVLPETRELYLFGARGLYELGPGIRGNTPFDLGFLENGAALNLVVGDGKMLRNYQLPKP